MSREHLPLKNPRGGRFQSGIPTRTGVDQPYASRGLLLTGVVVATYKVDDPDHFMAGSISKDAPLAVYCDVLAYTDIGGMRWRSIPNCLVLQDKGSMHSGRPWVPRAAKMDVTQATMDTNKATNPGNMDGEHVLVGFMNDSLNQPVILGGIAHPNTDEGNAAKTIGHRKQVLVADGDPDFLKHHGAFFGISEAGDFEIDTTQAYVGPDYASDGKERAAPADGTAGNINVRLPVGSKLTISIDTGETLELANKDGDATLKIGDGAVAVAIADHIKTMWDSLKLNYDLHVHPDAFGGTAVTTTKIPAWDASIKSTKVTLPDG